MYNDYFDLKEDPFNITPDPRFLYYTPQHTEALNHLLYGILQRKGFILLTGEVGAGKTTLCRALLNHLDNTWRTALILNPALSQTQLLRAIVEEFGIQDAGNDRLAHLRALNGFLLKANGAGHDAVLVIDEAQNLTPGALEMVRMLSNLETEQQKLLQIVLVGQPELRDILARDEFRQLAQRITVRFHLGTLTRQDTAAYVRHRLTVAGLDTGADDGGKCPLQFDNAALKEIHRYSRGTPRLINAVGDKALLAGYVKGTARIGRRLVRRAVRELEGNLR